MDGCFLTEGHNMRVVNCTRMKDHRMCIEQTAQLSDSNIYRFGGLNQLQYLTKLTLGTGKHWAVITVFWVTW